MIKPTLYFIKLFKEKTSFVLILHDFKESLIDSNTNSFLKIITYFRENGELNYEMLSDKTKKAIEVVKLGLLFY